MPDSQSEDEKKQFISFNHDAVICYADSQFPVKLLIHSNVKRFIIISRVMYDNLNIINEAGDTGNIQIIINKYTISIPTKYMYITNTAQTAVIIGAKFLMYLHIKNIDIFNKYNHISYMISNLQIHDQVFIGYINTYIGEPVDIIIHRRLYKLLQNFVKLTGNMDFRRRCLIYDNVQEKFTDTVCDNKVNLQTGILQTPFFMHCDWQMIRLSNIRCAIYGSESSNEPIQCFLTCHWLKLIMQFNIGPA